MDVSSAVKRWRQGIYSARPAAQKPTPAQPLTPAHSLPHSTAPLLTEPPTVAAQSIPTPEPATKKRKLDSDDTTATAVSQAPEYPHLSHASEPQYQRPVAAAAAPRNAVCHNPLLPTDQDAPPVSHQASSSQQEAYHVPADHFAVQCVQAPVLQFDSLYPNFEDAIFYIQNLIQYIFLEPDYLKEALCGRKGVPIAVGTRVLIQGNQRLAIVGDIALRMVIWDSWFENDETCGETEKKFVSLARNDNLRRVGRQHRIDRYVYKVAGDGCNKIVPTAVEAIIGAVWLDSNKSLECVKAVVEILLGVELTQET